MQLEHISRESFYRKPFGAVTVNSQVRLRLYVHDGGLPHRIRLVYRIDGGKEQFVNMPFVFSVHNDSIYEATVAMPDMPCLVWYYFEVATDNAILYYGNNSENLGGKGFATDCVPDNAFQITVYKKEYETPQWFKDAVAYQIFPDRFYNPDSNGGFLGNRSDIIKRSWGDTPFYKTEQFGGEYKANDFFGGNLEGIIEKLPYLEDLGISVIYLNPIFKAASNHKYDTGSYEEIDPMFGDEETFSRLCKEAKKRGIRIILDGVFNHTGDDSMYFNKYGHYPTVGAYQSKESKFYPWFNFTEYPHNYESWWGMTTLPQVNEKSEELRKYLLSDENSIVKKWIRLGASGWRLDVVDELPDFFVEELNRAVKSVDPDAVIIGEVWEDASNKIAYGERRKYFYGDELDSVMNYPLKNSIIDLALSHIDASEFDRRIMSLKENYPEPAYYSLLNMLSSHDTERITTLMGGAPSRYSVDRDFQAQYKLSADLLALARKRTKLAYGLVMTMPGVPCIFYGDELGIEGYGDPFCRCCFPWDSMNEVDPQGEMRSWIKELIALRKANEALRTGEMESVYALGNTYAYMRTTDDGKFLVVANAQNNACRIRLDIARYGIKGVCSVISSHGDAGTMHTSEDGIFFIDTEPYSVTVYKCD